MAKVKSSKILSTRKKPAGKRQQRGSVVSFVFGMVFGMVVALGVALYVSKAQLPFSGAKTQGANPNVSPGPNKPPPDPNNALYKKSGAKPTDNAVVADPFGATGAADAKQPVARNVYYLQLGSFRNREDAEQLRARLAFVGTESDIAVGDVNGSLVNRVRVGPFDSASDAYQARVPLTKGGFEAAVIKE